MLLSGVFTLVRGADIRGDTVTRRHAVREGMSWTPRRFEDMNESLPHEIVLGRSATGRTWSLVLLDADGGELRRQSVAADTLVGTVDA